MAQLAKFDVHRVAPSVDVADDFDIEYFSCIADRFDVDITPTRLQKRIRRRIRVPIDSCRRKMSNPYIAFDCRDLTLGRFSLSIQFPRS